MTWKHDDAAEAFEKWWQALPLRDDIISADEIRAAWDAGVLHERAQCRKIVDQVAAMIGGEIEKRN